MANPSPGRYGDIRRDRRVVLKVAALSLLLPLVRIAAAGDEAPAIAHETVVVPSGALQLKAFLATKRYGTFSCRSLQSRFR